MDISTPRRPTFLVALLIVVALTATACGSDATPQVSGEPPTTITALTVNRAALVDSAPVSELATGFNDAGFELLKEQPASDNLIFSPLSIGHAMLMARAAADEPTGAAIDSAFNLPEGTATHDAWNTLDHALRASEGTSIGVDGEPSPIVTVADRLWPAATANPNPAWVELLGTHHGADVEQIDVTSPEESRDRINAWVSDQTNELIPELLPTGFIKPNTVLVLTDAVYFKAQWQNVFGKYGPIEGEFTRLDGSTAETEFMVDLEQNGRRGVSERFEAAEVPYLGDDYSMLLIIPDEGKFDEVRGDLSQELLNEIDTTFLPAPFELRMPKWETTTSIDLLPWLTNVGAAPGSYPDISPDAQLAGAVHGADISVDEIGTEAAAATALGFDESGGPQPELVVAADKPFLYLIRHVDTGAVLFAGQVTDPGSV